MDTFPNRFVKAKHRKGLRIVGVDDGPFSPSKKLGERAILVAVLCEESRIKTIRIGSIEVDGSDAVAILQTMLRRLRFDLLLLSGISFGGFNLIDISKLARTMSKPVIAISREKPNNQTVKVALLEHFKDWNRRWNIVRAAGRLYTFKPLTDEPKLYFEVKRASPDYAKRIMKETALISRLPEPLRIARIIARGLGPG